ncbi:ABC transporter ATP-binding protein [Dysgonomonas sp. 511]|uniref:ABC transporter ATP-binding protein n=1 Tax=Dysgonomonas sp. 511 TaxID=2302930 RepID=UPI0016246630|nr:ABC transporter ATP-binding protein [Dysgonomonas sp. 511]
MSKKVVISAESISIGYSTTKKGDRNILYNNLNFDLYQGELVCLLGANGAGKSTLLRTISTSQPVLNGQISLYEKNIVSYSNKDISRNIGLVLTEKTSTGGLLVRELVELGRYPYTSFFGRLGKTDNEIVSKAMYDVGIGHKAESYVAELSDGERQKVMIAKALAQECPIVILDEPTAFLDIESRIEIMNLLHHLAVSQDKTILLSTHDIDVALLLADRLWLLSKENGLRCGTTEDIVLSGAIDNFFKKGNIEFNKETGSFLPIRNFDRKIYLSAENQTLYFWTKNLLLRNGFALTDNKSDSPLILDIRNEKCMELDAMDENETKEFESFQDLSDYIKSLK